MQLRQASRRKTKLRIGMAGPSGSGKTYSALLLARGLTDSWEKVAMIDTENGSGEMYSHLGAYQVLTLGSPYSPERYIQAIQACEDAGVEVIVIDSATHEWDGQGGCLQLNETLANAKFRGNTWAAWSETTPRHQAFINKILGSNCHVVTTVRSKTDTIQTEDKKVKKVGMKEIQRDGFEYELTVNFNIDRDTHFVTVSKDRTEIFEGQDPFKITQKTGETLLKWATEGLESFKNLISELLAMIEIADKLSDLTKVKEKLQEAKLPAEDEKAIIYAMRVKAQQFGPDDKGEADKNVPPAEPVEPQKPAPSEPVNTEKQIKPKSKPQKDGK